MSEKLTRKEAKERTRQALIDALIDVIRAQGISELNASKVAAAAGVAQSSFYFHFSGLDEAMKAAAVQIGAAIRATIHEQRQTIPLDDPARAVRASYEASIDSLMAHPELTELMLAQRRDPGSPLGQCFGDILDDARVDLLADMKRMGLTDVMLPHMEIHAEFILAMTLWAVEGLIDGRFASKEDCLSVLVHVTQASMMAAVSRR